MTKSNCKLFMVVSAFSTEAVVSLFEFLLSPGKSNVYSCNARVCSAFLWDVFLCCDEMLTSDH